MVTDERQQFLPSDGRLVPKLEVSSAYSTKSVVWTGVTISMSAGIILLSSVWSYCRMQLVGYY